MSIAEYTKLEEFNNQSEIQIMFVAPLNLANVLVTC